MINELQVMCPSKGHEKLPLAFLKKERKEFELC